MADKPTDPPNPEYGWGQLLPKFFKDPAMIVNHAANGRSTRSFITEGRWQKLLDALQPGDWVIIQFAHNDEKIFPNARGEFQDNLRHDNLFLECPCHGSKFHFLEPFEAQSACGQVKQGPATTNLKRYDVVTVKNKIYLES